MEAFFLKRIRKEACVNIKKLYVDDSDHLGVCIRHANLIVVKDDIYGQMNPRYEVGEYGFRRCLYHSTAVES